MKNVHIKGGQYLRGSIPIPPSKSLSHRAVIAAGLAQGESVISHIIYSVDIEATIKTMVQLGAKVSRSKDSLKIRGNGGHIKTPDSALNCRESGSTLRFMVPLAMLGHRPVTFCGEGALVGRPLGPYLEIFQDQGLDYDYSGQLPLRVKGPLKPSHYTVAGHISSQFISGLLLSLPLLDAPSTITVLEPFESREYVTLTLDVLKAFGIEVSQDGYTYTVPGNQCYRASNYRVEGDYSQLAFWLVAGLVNGEITCQGICPDSKQGDRAILQIIHAMKGTYSFEGLDLTIGKQTLKASVIDGAQCPDIIPVLAVLAAVTPGQTRIINASRLRIKECDRLHAITTELRALGADINELEDGLIIEGKTHLKGGHVKGWNDHRIVMALAVASLACTADVYIQGSEAITKSYPHFWEHFRQLGGHVNEWHMEA